MENLEWCTRSENHLHAMRLGLRKAPRMFGNNHARKLTKEKIEELKTLKNKGWSTKDLSDKFKITANTVRNICKGKTCKDFSPT